MRPVYDNAGIDQRNSCVPLDWYLEPHGWPERSEIYLRSAVDLYEQATRQCLDAADLATEDIAGIVSVSTTGIATPSLDAQLVERLGLRRDIVRLPIFGLGCAGGVLGLARAADLARSLPGQNVLFLVVELCGLSFRLDDLSKSNLIASALFGDGAAGAILSTEGEGLQLYGSAEYTWPDTLDVMGWRVMDDGLEVVFSRDIPALIRDEMRGVTDWAKTRLGLSESPVDCYICHPGGAKVIDALEEVFDLGQGAMNEAREVMRSHGNMSAATVFFVLKRILEGPNGRFGQGLMTAMGPGFTAGFQHLTSA